MSKMRMKCAVCVMALILVSSHFPFPTTAYESISKPWIGIDVPSLQQGEILDSKWLVRSRKMKIVGVNKKRLRTIPVGGRGAGTGTKSSADRYETSLLRVYFVVIFSVFFAFFCF